MDRRLASSLRIGCADQLDQPVGESATPAEVIVAAGELAERYGISLRAQDVSKVPRTLEDGATSRESVRLEDSGIEIETHWLAVARCIP